MEETPERLTERFIIQNAEYALESSTSEWDAWIWKQFVLLKVFGNWQPENYAHNLSQFWDIFCERKTRWEKVYVVIDANEMEIQTEEFRRYLKENWIQLLDREDLSICLAEAKAMKRLIWNDIYKFWDKKNRTMIFKDSSAAFVWIRGQRVKNGA